MDEIRKNLGILRERWPDTEDQAMFTDWEKAANKAMVVANAKSHDGIKIILKAYTAEIAECEKALRTNPALFKNEEGMELGRLLHTRIDWCKRFLKLFEKAEISVKGIKNNIDKSLNEK